MTELHAQMTTSTIFDAQSQRFGLVPVRSLHIHPEHECCAQGTTVSTHDWHLNVRPVMQVSNYGSLVLWPKGPNACMRKKAHADSGTLTILASDDWLDGVWQVWRLHIPSFLAYTCTYPSQQVKVDAPPATHAQIQGIQPTSVSSHADVGFTLLCEAAQMNEVSGNISNVLTLFKCQFSTQGALN